MAFPIESIGPIGERRAGALLTGETNAEYDARIDSWIEANESLILYGSLAAIFLTWAYFRYR